MAVACTVCVFSMKYTRKVAITMHKFKRCMPRDGRCTSHAAYSAREDNFFTAQTNLTSKQIIFPQLESLSCRCTEVHSPLSIPPAPPDPARTPHPCHPAFFLNRLQCFVDQTLLYFFAPHKKQTNVPLTCAVYYLFSALG